MTSHASNRPLRCAIQALVLGLGLLLPALTANAFEGSGGTLRVAIDNVRGAKGRVHVDLCTEAQFLKDCPISADAPARPGVSVVTIAGLRPGRYAVEAYYDENGNGKVDRALFGIPKEGVGFSRDAPIRLAPPKWVDAGFDYDGRDATIRLKLRYFIGPNYSPSSTASR